MLNTKFQSKKVRDVFNAFLLQNTFYTDGLEFPVINPTYFIPKRLIAFSKAISSKDYDQWIHFYEDDYRFERLWNNPKRYLELLSRFDGVILPDFSLYRDFPYVMQLWNIFRSRIIGSWLQQNGVKVIPNIRYADKRTYKICCKGISKHSVISIGSHGTLKRKKDRELFTTGLKQVVDILEPVAIIVYGSAPDSIFKPYKDAGIKIIQFESACSASHKEVV